MSSDPTRYAGFLHRWRVRRRIAELEWKITHERMLYVGTLAELNYLKRTGRLDWVDPYTPPVRPATDRLKPPPPQPR